MHFEAGDINRLPLFAVESADQVFATLDGAFTLHESHREPSVEFKSPGPSPWQHAQKWAQDAVDRAPGAALPPYTPVFDAEPPTDHVSYAFGLVLGRFDANGIADPASTEAPLPGGLLFLDGATELDDLDVPATQPLRDAWRTHGPAIDGTNDVRGLRAWLRTSFFAVHRKMYDNRPIHWPLTSANRTFVAWMNIHRMGPQTLPAVLARAESALLRLRGRAGDLRRDRDGADATASKAAERLLGPIQKQLVEIEKFVADLRSLATKGPPQGAPPREVDAPYAPDLDDGVMINSAALWPILEPQWKDPKKWWAELAKAEGRKDYDWSHLAARYWPDRVGQKCRKDPSLGVAHGCFWRYHPARAYAWELRLQDEIGPEFRIDEADADACREKFLRDEPGEAKKIRAKERKRRRKKYGDDVQIVLFGAPADEADDLVDVDETASESVEEADDEGGASTAPPRSAHPPLRVISGEKKRVTAGQARPETPVLPRLDAQALASAATGAWASPTSEPVGVCMAFFAAILRILNDEVPADIVRCAAALALHPDLVRRLLDPASSREWRRVVGAQADATLDRLVAVHPGWGEAVGLLITHGLVEERGAEVWAPGEGLDGLPRFGWAEGRALVALATLGEARLTDEGNAVLEDVRRLYASTG